MWEAYIEIDRQEILMAKCSAYKTRMFHLRLMAEGFKKYGIGKVSAQYMGLVRRNGSTCERWHLYPVKALRYGRLARRRDN